MFSALTHCSWPSKMYTNTHVHTHTLASRPKDRRGTLNRKLRGLAETLQFFPPPAHQSHLHIPAGAKTICKLTLPRHSSAQSKPQCAVADACGHPACIGPGRSYASSGHTSGSSSGARHRFQNTQRRGHDSRTDHYILTLFTCPTTPSPDSHIYDDAESTGRPAVCSVCRGRACIDGTHKLRAGTKWDTECH